jgi:hypothetical protein
MLPVTAVKILLDSVFEYRVYNVICRFGSIRQNAGYRMLRDLQLSMMRVQLPRVKTITHRLTALALMLWLGGVGCLIGCEIPASAAPVDVTQTSDAAESCSMNSGGDCCHKAEQSKETGKAPTIGALPQSRNISSLSCCPLVGLSSDPARKASASDAPLVIAANVLFLAPKIEHPSKVVSLRSQTRDRGSTYLRCCVFLI